MGQLQLDEGTVSLSGCGSVILVTTAPHEVAPILALPAYHDSNIKASASDVASASHEHQQTALP